MDVFIFDYTTNHYRQKLELKTLKLAKEKRIKMRKKGYEEEFYKENPYFRCQKIYQVVKYQFK